MLLQCFFCFHWFVIFVNRYENKSRRATAVLRTPRFAHFSFPHLHISLLPSSYFPLFSFTFLHFLICIFLSSIPLISLYSLSHFSTSSFAYFSLSSLILFPSLPPSYFPFSHFSIPEQMEHTCNFLDFYLCFQMVSWQRQIGYRIYISLIPKIQRLKIQNMRYIIGHLLCAKKSQFGLKIMSHIVWAGHTGRGVRSVLLDPQHLHHTESPQVCLNCYTFSPKPFWKVTNHSQLVNISHEISVTQKYVKSTLSSIVTFTHLINEK